MPEKSMTAACLLVKAEYFIPQMEKKKVSSKKR